MYAKLFSRITESSLMEEPINVRYTFVMLLAIADPKGYAIGTDVAICRRLNMPVNEFKQCVEILMRPDPDSNSKEEEGRRVIPSDGERGYKIVNYLTYREIKDQQERREYMKEYMRSYRVKKPGKQGSNRRKLQLTQLTQAEAEVKEEAKAPPENLRTPAFKKAWTEWSEYRKQAKLKPYTCIGKKKQWAALSEIGPERAITAINHSIANGYQGIFEPKSASDSKPRVSQNGAPKAAAMPTIDEVFNGSR